MKHIQRIFFVVFFLISVDVFAQNHSTGYLSDVPLFADTLNPQKIKRKSRVQQKSAAKLHTPKLPPYKVKGVFKFSGIPSLTFTQTAFSNWAAGGVNSIAGVGNASFKLTYTEPNFTWETNLDMAYGLTYQDDEFFKNNDKLEFLTKFGLKSSQKWYYSLLLQMKTQFDKGYKSYPPADKSKYSSRFMAPGYFIGSLGMDYKPTDGLSLLFSPVSAKCTFVLDTMLSNQGLYGVTPGDKTLSELGSLVKATYAKTFKSKYTVKSNLELFSSWLNDPEKIDVGFEFDLNIKISKWFWTRFYTQLLYDNDTKIKDSDTGEVLGARLQFKQMLGVGVSMSF